MRAIFISYRRDDSEGQAGRLFDDLKSHFGEGAVFMDVAGLEAGRDFRRAIDDQVASCDVLLAIIGRNWLTVTDEAGARRLDDPMDFVRLEIASALTRDIPVVPVLVQGARAPRADELPDNLKELSFRNGVELTHARWESDVQLLIKALRPVVQVSPAVSGGSPPTAPAAPRRGTVPVIIGLAVAVLVAAATGYTWYRNSDNEGRGRPGAGEPPATAKTPPANEGATSLPVTPTVPPVTRPVPSVTRTTPPVTKPTTPATQPTPSPAVSAPLIPGIWRGTLTFYATVTPISIQFDDDFSLDLTSPRGTVASGTWSRRSNNMVFVDARHQQLGAFACELKATDASITGRCAASGNYAGDIALSERGPLNP